MLGRPLRMRLSKTILIGAVCSALMIGAPAAYAVSSAQQGYSTPGGVVQTQVDNGGKTSKSNNSEPATQTPAATTQTSSGNLPFTGLDVALIVAAGGLLLLVGFGVRRLSRPADVA